MMTDVDAFDQGREFCISVRITDNVYSGEPLEGWRGRVVLPVRGTACCLFIDRWVRADAPA